MTKNIANPNFHIPAEETAIYDPSKRVVRAKGSKIWFKGSKDPYYDLLMGYSSTNFGHANPSIVQFVRHAAKQFDNVTSFDSDARDSLTTKLVSRLPHPTDKQIYYPVGGAKAVDAAIKLAKAYTGKDEMLSFKGAFHGFGMGGMAVTDSAFVNKTQFGSLPGEATFFTYPDNSSDKGRAGADQTILEIEGYLSKHNSKVGGIIFEPIQGAAGFIVPPEDFLPRLIDLAKRYDVVSICDEIQTGVGRTGTFYRSDKERLDPDILLLGKSLAGGYYPLSAVIASSRIFERLDKQHSGFDSTFSGNQFGIAIANQVLDYIDKEKILKRVRETGKDFLNMLKGFDHLPFLQNIQGTGMAFSYRVESAELARKIRSEAFTNGLIFQTAGVNGDYMKLSPSFFITKSEIGDVHRRLNKTFQAIT